MAKYCPEIVQKIAGYVADGNFATVASAACGIAECTYYAWLNDPDKPEFSQAIKEAEAKAETTALAAIQSDPSWQSKAWYLERKFKNNWAKTENQNINHSGTIDTSKKSLDDYYKDNAPAS
jgi:hypothetical protein